MARRVYKSMMGKTVDMELLSKANELTPAIGNARVNARGDELGPGGKIIRKREEIVSEYYDRNPAAVREEQFKRTPLPAVAPTTKETATRRTSAKKEEKNEDQSNS